MNNIIKAPTQPAYTLAGIPLKVKVKKWRANWYRVSYRGVEKNIYAVNRKQAMYELIDYVHGGGE